MYKNPNVIIIQTDQMSAKSLGIYGNEIVKTPILEEFAKKSAVFTNAFCNYPACAPSRSSMMTGRYASTIRNHANHMLINPQEVTLSLVMKQAGYETALIGKNHAFLVGENYYPDAPAGERNNIVYDEINRNFDYVVKGGHVNVDGRKDDSELDEAIRWAKENCWGNQHHWGVNPYPCEKSITHVLASRAVDYIKEERNKEKPFFLWLSIPDPHTPYQVSEPYASMYDPQKVPKPIKDDLKNKPERQTIAKLLDYNHEFDDEHFQKIRSIHYGMINQIDDNLMKVFDVLKEVELENDTIILFVSDHGDAMGDHGAIQKHNFFYESFTKIPFIISWPGHIRPRKTNCMVELVDIMPTVLELAGIMIPSGVQGKSIAPFLLDKEKETKEYIVIESGEHGEPITLKDIMDEDGKVIDKGTSFAWCAFREAWYGKGKCIRTVDWKLNIYANGEGELYDMQNDPDELNNLYNQTQYEEIQNKLTMKLLLWSFEKEDKVPLNTRVVDKYHYFKGDNSEALFLG